LCSLGLYWNGTLCISCPNGLTWNAITSSCACKNGSYFNGVQCITCDGGMIFDSVTYACICPTGTAWNGTHCTSACVSPFILTNGQCLCPLGMIPSQNNCINSPNCPTGMVWTNNQCQNISCSPGSYWNGSICLQYTPSCPINSFWNGQACISNNVHPDQLGMVVTAYRILQIAHRVHIPQIINAFLSLSNVFHSIHGVDQAVC
jgi:hypothetical protein